MQSITKLLLFAILATTAVGCENARIGLGSLGSRDDFSDLEIDKDFEAPEDEEERTPEPPKEDEEETPTPEPVPPPTPPKVEPPSEDGLINTFYIEKRDFALARGPAKRWDGCKAGYKTMGGYDSHTRCGRAFLHKKFGENLNRAFYKCSFDAARDAGYPNIQKIFVHHIGSYNDRNARNSSSLSNHAYARALDIKYFNLFDSRGVNYRVSTLKRDYKGSQAKFYDSFRQCWKDSLSSNCRPGQREYKGSVGHRSSKLGGNSLHDDHIHLAFPKCAG